MLKVNVIDNGTGIAIEDQQLLFKQFGKLQRTAALNPDGIGIGLHLCASLVKANHG